VLPQLQKVNTAIERGRKLKCAKCKQFGATIGCEVCLLFDAANYIQNAQQVANCPRTYHYQCAINAGCQMVEAVS